MLPLYPSFGIVGAGFSGSLLAVHLLRRLPCRVHLIERRLAFGRGLAYSTGNPDHLLNVRTGRMSAFEDDPDHFLRWLSEQEDERIDTHPAAFVPRAAYGRYIQSILGEQLRRAGGDQRLELVADEASAISFDNRGATIDLAGGRSLGVDAAILAVGNFPPDGPRALDGLCGSARYIADPWNEQQLDAITPMKPVLVIGTGLTMVDFVLSLLGRGHRGPVLAISRHGLLPHRHDAAAAPAFWQDELLPGRLSALLHAVRDRATGDDWRSLVDGMRPHLPDWWQRMSMPEQRRFLRHLRPWWDSHRHRMAPEVAEKLDDARASGRLAIAAGQIVGATECEEAIRVVYRPRNSQERCRVTVGCIVNCSGPANDVSRISQPLVRRLLDTGVIRPDPLRLGLDVDEDLRLLSSQGQPNSRLFAVGPLTKGRFWEVTAVPEIRRQTEWLAARLSEQGYGDDPGEFAAEAVGACREDGVPHPLFPPDGSADDAPFRSPPDHGRQ